MTTNNPDSMHRRSHSEGFTLVEMAIVVTIAAVLLTLGIGTAISVLQSTQRSTTKDRQTAVRDALLAYFTTNHRLPCPDNGSNVGNNGRDGVEDTVGGGAPVTFNNCTTALGTVPYVTLGIAREQALDAYGNFMTYRLDTARIWNQANTFIPAATCLVPGITAAPLAGLSVFSAPATVSTNRAVVVLVSHGPNGLGAWNQGPTNTSRNALPTAAAEMGNTALNPAGPAGYRDYAYSDAAANPFDDIVTPFTFTDVDTLMRIRMLRANICS
jgi:prepilin-type N-terminal cleavage/methylation domain-containing protein